MISTDQVPPSNVQVLCRRVLHVPQYDVRGFPPPACMIARASKPATIISCAAPTRMEWPESWFDKSRPARFVARFMRRRIDDVSSDWCERANRNRKSPCWLRTVSSVGPCVPKCSLPARDPQTVFGLMHGLRMVQRACRVTTIRLSISNFDRSQTDCCRIDGCCVGLITSQAEVGAR